MIRKGDENDPKGLILEAYRIDGITKAECRTIFLDWALSLPDGRAPATMLEALLKLYETANPAHPMTDILREGSQSIAKPGRRGGWRARTRIN